MESLTIEHNYFMVITFSLLLVTTSLLFFHMTVLKTVELPKIFAKIFSISLILISCIYNGIAIYQYHQRMLESNQEDSIHEKVYWYFYLILGIIFMIICISICIVMIGKLNDSKLKKKKR